MQRESAASGTTHITTEPQNLLIRAHLIGELDYSGVSDYNPWAVMVRGLATVEHARTPNGEADTAYASDTIELSAATYEKLRRLAAECLRTKRPGRTPSNGSAA